MNLVFEEAGRFSRLRTLEITRELIEEIYPDAKPRKVEEILQNIENGTFPLQNLVEHLNLNFRIMDVESEDVAYPDPDGRYYYFQKEEDRGNPQRHEGKAIEV